MNTLPIVDISPFLLSSSDSTPSAKQTAAKQLYAACHDVGFFYLAGHNIPPEQCNRLLKTVKEWMLTATTDEKEAIARREAGDGVGDGARGYQRLGENVTGGKSVSDISPGMIDSGFQLKVV
ncbi:hypothetical protein TWF694_006833 [Orbilia ellipsospora]|uniref:Non-haem dioxygenase N-terminal domain-containing protein n=1 Tax=Orbilia ellipsospora TaxID=2528407 RepID=A0AAV9XNY8_9PEZI